MVIWMDYEILHGHHKTFSFQTLTLHSKGLNHELWHFRIPIFIRMTILSLILSSIGWCVRCLLITESPKTPGHCRYLKFGSSATSLIWDWRCSVCDFSCSCVYCDFEFLKFVFSMLQSRSCFQLTNSCLLRGREGLLLWIGILSFLLLIGIFSK